MYKNVYTFLDYILIIEWITTWQWSTPFFPVPLLGISVTISNLNLFFDKPIKAVLCQVINGCGVTLRGCRKNSLREGPMIACSHNNIMPHPTCYWKFGNAIPEQFSIGNKYLKFAH